MVEMSLSEAGTPVRNVVRQISGGKDRVALTDDGHVAAVIIDPEELVDLEAARALAVYEARMAADPSHTGIPLAEVRARLGLTQQ